MNTIISVLYIASGIASQYGPGIMESVVEHRQAGRAWQALPEFLPPMDHVAVLDCAEFGYPVSIRYAGEAAFHQALVVDCAGDAETVEWMERHNILLEMSHGKAVELDTVNVGHPAEMIRYRYEQADPAFLDGPSIAMVQ